MDEAAQEQLQLRGDINQALVESGDHDKIFTLLLDLLRSSGWYESTRSLCVDQLRSTVVAPDSPMPGQSPLLPNGAVGTSASQKHDPDADAEMDAEGEDDVSVLGAGGGGADSASQQQQQQQQALRPIVTNYDSLYKAVEGMAWSTVPDDVKTEVVGEIKKILQKILVAE